MTIHVSKSVTAHEGSNNKKLEDIGTITVKQYQEVLKNILY